MDVTYITPEQKQEAYDANDMGVINGIIEGNVKVRQQQEIDSLNETEPQEQAPAPVEDNNTLVEQPTDAQEAVDEPTRESSVDIDERIKQIREKQEMEKKLEEARKKEEELAQYREELNKEKKEREILEKQMKELTERISNTPNSDDEDVDDEYASEYSKHTRKELDRIKQQLENSSMDTSSVDERIARLEATIKEREEMDAQREEEERQAKLQETFVKNVSSFLDEHPELKPSKSLEELRQDIQQFRADIRTLTQAKSLPELESYIEDYNKGGKTRRLAEENGIKPVDDYMKWEVINDIIDMKNGKTYDKYTGKHEDIVDDYGNPVRYRTYSEAYKLSNYYNDVNQARFNAYKEVSEKLKQINNSAVVLDSDSTENVSSELSVGDKRKLINIPPQELVNNPDLLQKVKQVYKEMGLSPLVWKGQRLW